MTAVVDLAGWTLLHFLWQGALIGALATGGLHLSFRLRRWIALMARAPPT
jgi:hypothetical protein